MEEEILALLQLSPVLPFIWTALVVRTRFALILHFRIWPIRLHAIPCQMFFFFFFFLINKDMVQILLVHVGGTFIRDSKVKDMFSGDPSGSEPSMFFGLAV